MEKYLEKPKKPKKNDGPGKQKPFKNFKIIDDDIDINSLQPSQDAEIFVDLLDPEGPAVVDDDGSMYNKPKLVKKIDLFSNDKWIKVDVVENEDGDLLVAGEQNNVASKGLFKKRGEKLKTSQPSVNDDDDDNLDIPRNKNGKKDSDGDISPVRRKTTSHDDDEDLDSIPRKRNAKITPDRDLSPVRRKPNGQDEKNSKKRDKDLSPARKPGLNYSDSKSKIKQEIKQERDISPVRKSATNRKEDNSDEHRVREKKAKKEEEIKKAKEEELKKKYNDWKKGLVQVRQEEEKIQDYLHEVDKPLARHVDDKDLDHLLKKQEREDDPMLEYMRTQNNDAQGEKKKKYTGPPAPPNRYNILPGSKWDGVDRSNGFEKKYYESIMAKKAKEQEAYKWSTEDM